MSNREFKSILNIIKDNSFLIDGRIIYNIYNGLPTEFILSKEENNFKLNIYDFEKYQFICDGKYIIYNNSLYILNKEEKDYLNLLKQNKINELIFDKKQLNEFSSGLFNKIKNNISIDENITEISLPVKPKIKLYFDILYSKLKCDVVFEYKEKEINYFSKETILRDNETETEVINEIVNYGFIEENNSFIMTDDDDIYTFIEEKMKH